ncbi:MAG: metallophosphoesterase [Planctomycetes bacterium]|nr:metallophosphoesterase [Planctomycetota bacterium]
MSVRFLHTSDWQMGMKGARLGEAALRLTEERLAALGRVLQLAVDHEVSWVLASGDLFEHNEVAEDLVASVAAVLGAYPQIEIHAIPGNHDLAGPASVWNRLPLRQCANLRVHTRSEAVELEGWTLHPCPVRSRHQGTDPLEDLPDLHDRPGIQVAMAHGHLTTVNFSGHEDEIRLPIDPAQVDRVGLDYLALGHWHGTRIVNDARGVARIAYSGTHEQTHFRETDSGQVLLVDIAAKGAPPQITTLRSGGLKWNHIAFEFLGDDNLLRLDERLRDDRSHFLRLDLAGELPQALFDPLRERLESEETHRAHLRVDTSAIRYRQDLGSGDLVIEDAALKAVHRRLEAELAGAAGEADQAAPHREALALFERLLREELA